MKKKTWYEVILIMLALFFISLTIVALSCILVVSVVDEDEPTHYEEEEAKVETLKEEHKVNAEELEMLSCLIYREAGADTVCDECRRRVADVVLNRIDSDKFPDTMYEVLTQKKQYGTMYYDGITWPERANEPEEVRAVERAYDIAEDVLSGHHSELYGNGYIWQAEFEQGSHGFWHCGIYFGQ